MDLQRGGATSIPSTRPSFPRHLSGIGSPSAVYHNGVSSGDWVGERLRRGHSDGETLGHAPERNSKVSNEESTVGARARWNYFSRAPPSGVGIPSTQSHGSASMPYGGTGNNLGHRKTSSDRRVSGNIPLPHHTDHTSLARLPVGHGGAPIRPHSPPSNDIPISKIANQPLRPRLDAETAQNRGSREITIPRWQPDNEVNKCPICGIAFSFWYRKHHCRKCGRVVCANCSPHRITIPRQFIVHPPEDAPRSPVITNTQGIEVVDLTGDDDVDDRSQYQVERPPSSDYSIDPGLGGGQEVRLCNPCVPDPNPLPHVPYASPTQNIQGSSRPNRVSSTQNRMAFSGTAALEQFPLNYDGRPPLMRPDDRLGGTPRLENRRISAPIRSIPTPIIDPLHRPIPQLQRHRIPQPDSSNIYGSAPNNTAHHVSALFLTKEVRANEIQRGLASVLQGNAIHNRHRQHASFGGFSDQARSHHLPSAALPVPRPQLREEDECPICHQALPSKGADGSETAREAHVQSCIESHFSSSGPRQTHPPPAVVAGASSAGNMNPPTQESSARPTSAATGVSVRSSDMPSASLQSRRRIAGMLVYNASEKDCVGADGAGGQECVICFEEFTVGDEMGRLECLCKFHKVWRMRHPKAYLQQRLMICCRNAYGSGGILRVLVLVLFIKKVHDVLSCEIRNHSQSWMASRMYRETLR